MAHPCVSVASHRFSSNRSTIGFEASTGDYLVSISVGGKAYKQVLHVDQVPAGEVRLP